jgi:hypothetical protein
MSAARPEVKWKNRGFKCITVQGKPVSGLHKAMQRHLWPHFHYERAKANGTLRISDPPPAQFFLPHATTRRERRLPYSRTQGILFDNQITSTVKLSRLVNAPGRVLFDSAFRLHFSKVKWGGVAAHKEGRRLRNACMKLLPETEMFWRTMVALQFIPLTTQVPVAWSRVGTRADVLARDKMGKLRIIEIKLGCDKNFSIGHMFAPFEDQSDCTHNQHLLQTLATHAFYRRDQPPDAMGLPLLMRFDRAGAHVYKQPQWATSKVVELVTCLNGC